MELTHSIPEMVWAVAITTKKAVMHTGDWKFDAAPMIGPVSDYELLKIWRRQGTCHGLRLHQRVIRKAKLASWKARCASTWPISSRNASSALSSLHLLLTFARVESLMLAAKEAGRGGSAR